MFRLLRDFLTDEFKGNIQALQSKNTMNADTLENKTDFNNDKFESIFTNIFSIII